MNIIVAFRVLLGLEKTLPNIGEEHITVLEQGVDGVGASSPCSIRKQGRRRTTIDHLKRRGAQGGVVGSTVAILRPGQPIKPGAG